MNDPLIETLRRDAVSRINAVHGTREQLEALHGQVWDTAQIAEDFEVLGFLAPVVAVTRKADGKVGSLLFQHEPRFYFAFMEDK